MTNTLPESTILVSLVLSINPLHAGQNHLLTPVRFSEERYLSKDKEMDLASGKEIISSFTSSMLQQPQVSHVVEVLTDVARMLLAIVEWPFNSSNTTWRISGTSCWVLNWKGTCLLVESFLWSAHKKLEGSRGVVRLFKSDIFRVTALVKGDRNVLFYLIWSSPNVIKRHTTSHIKALLLSIVWIL